jgi:hypothetical protein
MGGRILVDMADGFVDTVHNHDSDDKAQIFFEHIVLG